MKIAYLRTTFCRLGITASMVDLNLKNGLQSCDSQMGENRAEFELNTCSSKTPNLLQYGHEMPVDTRPLLQVFRFLRHQSPSLSTRPTSTFITQINKNWAVVSL